MGMFNIISGHGIVGGGAGEGEGWRVVGGWKFVTAKLAATHTGSRILCVCVSVHVAVGVYAWSASVHGSAVIIRD